MTEHSKRKDLEFEEMVSFLVSKGFPTFDQFSKDPDKYRLSRYHLMESIEKSTTINREQLAKQKCYWRHSKEAMSYGKILRVMADEGYGPQDCDCIPFRDTNSISGKDTMLVRIFPKSEMKAMGAIVANG